MVGRLSGRTSGVLRLTALLAALALLAGCGGDEGETEPQQADEPKALSIAQALEEKPMGPVLVEGYVVSAKDRPIRFCSALAESFPPQCGQPSLRLDEIELEALEVTEHEGTAWTAKPVQIIGLVRGEALVIEEPHQ